jgi:hypothetical protein
MRHATWGGTLATILTASLALGQRPGTRAAQVAPVLKAHCLACHSGGEKQGGFSLDGPLTPAQGKELLRRVRGEGGKPRMPLGFAPLSAEKVQALEKWVEAGAPTPTEPQRTTHWAFQPVTRPLEPPTEFSGIDAFVAARLEKEGLGFSPEADKTTLIRRATLDLTGLPPTPAEVDGFLADTRPDAYEKLVDRLLKDPHYGERMALPWLDAARYADSNGFQQDGDTHQWVWRDWVVDAFNKNLPYDRFVTEQLAGDLLPGASESQRIATAFCRNHLLNGEGGAIPEEQRNVILFDRVDVAATTFLGLTLACAQCHDHKYDPLTQKDYYRFLAFFNNVPETGTPPGGGQYRIAEPSLSVAPPEFRARKIALEARIAGARAELERGETPERRERLTTREKELARLVADQPKVMVMSDAHPRKTFVYDRGRYLSPKEEVVCGTPAALPGEASGNRLALARWLVSPDNPLTARVYVNRIWQQLFGVGLVKTSENFGLLGESPSHPELLDWLASEFVESGWDVKGLVKKVLLSRTYRQSSKATSALRARDPENRLLARGARFRLSSLILRDVALASSGLLNEKIGGKPVYPYQPPGIWDSLSITKERDFSYPQSKGDDLYRRSLYTFWRRTVGPGNMFDASSRQACNVRAVRTSTPLHALTTLNDVTWVEASRALAQRILRSSQTNDARLTDAFRRVLARRPKPAELAILKLGLTRAKVAYELEPDQAKALLSLGESPRDSRLDPAEHAAMTQVCLSLYNLDEALTKE